MVFCLPACRPDVFDGFDVFLARDHLSEDGVLAVEMGGGDRSDEELGTVAVRGISEGGCEEGRGGYERVGSCVCHAR